MSEPKRYAIRGFSAALVEEENGVFVRYEDYARLKAAFDLLDESIKLGPSTIPLSPGYYIWKESEQYALKENARLKAEVERLTKAGDAFYESEINYYGEQILNDPKHHSGHMCRDWNAAKEGKQP